MYSFFSWIILVPLVVKMTMQHSTKNTAVKGIETMRQKPDLTFFSSLNWSLRMKKIVIVRLSRIRITCTQPSKKPALDLLSTGQSWPYVSALSD